MTIVTLAIVDIIESGGYTRVLMDRLRDLEARQDMLRDRIAAAKHPLPDIHPNVAQIYRRKIERLAEALQHPEDQREAAEAIRALIERVTLIPGAKRGEMEATLQGELGAILTWLGAEGVEKASNKNSRRGSRESVGIVGCGGRI